MSVIQKEREELFDCCALTDGFASSKKLILFVCTGNTCRSPMAEVVFNTDHSDSGYRAESAGIYGGGAQMSPNSVLALEKCGYGSHSHVSRSVTAALLEEADKVVGMTSSHAMELIMRFPEYADKIYCLPSDVADPYGCSPEVYVQCLEEIKAALNNMVSGL